MFFAILIIVAFNFEPLELKIDLLHFDGKKLELQQFLPADQQTNCCDDQLCV
jgi:hypothetical protein